MKKGFTLIELLAVIVILAIIAIIATPIVLNIINESKKESEKRSVELYIDAVEKSVADESMKKSTINYDGFYEISSDGLILTRTSDSEKINVGIKGDKLKEGKLHIVDGKVVWIVNSKINDKNVKLYNGEITFKPQEKNASILSTGEILNQRLKTLSSGTTVTATSTNDEIIEYIDFYQNGKLPAGYIKEQLLALPNISVSNDNKINAYFDSNNKKIYIYSENSIKTNTTLDFSNFKSVKRINFNDIYFSKLSGISFKKCQSLEKVDLSNFDTSNIKSMYGTFENCSKLEVLDLSNFDTSNITDMRELVEGCSSLKNINLSNFNTSKVTKMRSMFYGCSSLETLDLSSFDTSNVTDMSRMFYGASSLKKLDLSNFQTPKLNSIQHLFFACSNLEYLDISGFDISNFNDIGTPFRYTNNLKVIYVGSGWKLKEGVDIANVLLQCGVDHVTYK